MNPIDELVKAAEEYVEFHGGTLPVIGNPYKGELVVQGLHAAIPAAKAYAERMGEVVEALRNTSETLDCLLEHAAHAWTRGHHNLMQGEDGAKFWPPEIPHSRAGSEPYHWAAVIGYAKREYDTLCALLASLDVPSGTAEVGPDAEAGTTSPDVIREAQWNFAPANDRGFLRAEFIDRYGKGCSIQASSLADEECIWLGINDAEPKIMASKAIRLGLPNHGETTGWVPYDVPDDVRFTTRMHLTRKMAGKLAIILAVFAESGALCAPPTATAEVGPDAEGGTTSPDVIREAKREAWEAGYNARARDSVRVTAYVETNPYAPPSATAKESE